MLDSVQITMFLRWGDSKEHCRFRALLEHKFILLKSNDNSSKWGTKQMHSIHFIMALAWPVWLNMT